ncbi:alpha/beta hydrolase [Actinomycetota bacterium]|nr:alpha/beta hydrolase [Actinomycetota bacterium]
MTTTSALLPGAPFPVTAPGSDRLDDDRVRVDHLLVTTAAGPLTAVRARPATQPVRGQALLVPGFTGSKEDFLPLLPLLAARGWDVLAYSQRGQADSAHATPDEVGSYGLDDFARDALVVAAALAADGAPGVGRVHLLGHSFGGVVARAAALLSPGSFADLTLLCSGPHGWPDRKADVVAALEAHPEASTWELDHRDDPTAAADPEQAFFRERAARTSRASLLGALAILQDTTDTTAALAATGLPVLVAHGEADDAWPQAWQQAMATTLGARYTVIPGAGHLPNTEAPEATAAELRTFWSQHH